MVSKHVSRGTILDYGCGTGMFLKVCQDNGWKSFGMEPDEGAAKIATKMGLTVFSDKVKLNSYTQGGDLKFDTICNKSCNIINGARIWIWFIYKK